MFAVVILAIGFLILVKGADLLIDGSASLAKRFNVSDIVIGLTVVAFGTSAPELFVNLAASFEKSSGIAFGNVVGSTIANILLVLGGGACFYPLTVKKGTAWKEIPFSIFAAVLLILMVCDLNFSASATGFLGRYDGVVLLFFFVLFLGYSFYLAFLSGDNPEPVPEAQGTIGKGLLLIGAGLVSLFFGSKMIVFGAVNIADFFGISETAIGLSIVAVGTCLPELATTVIASLKKKPDIAVGNIVGSNIFNILFVLGVSSLVYPIEFEPELWRDLFFLMIANALLFLSLFSGRRRMVDRWEGLVFVAVYILYLVMIFK